jgi:hypothetical protein
VDVGAARASFLGLRLVSLWSRWSSSSSEWPSKWQVSAVAVSLVAGLGGGGAVHSSSPACAW